MRLRFYSLAFSLSDFACRSLMCVYNGVQLVRVWAWTRATKENLRTCNSRQPERERFV